MTTFQYQGAQNIILVGIYSVKCEIYFFFSKLTWKEVCPDL